jgi:hypothetical protein
MKRTYQIESWRAIEHFRSHLMSDPDNIKWRRP